MTTGQLDTGRAMILSPGESFGAYTIIAPLGRGGMGEVYRARDNRLGRDVALKILPDEAADDPESIRRFEQEARAASALNHPNIVVIYETGEATPAGRDRPVRFLAMELLDGEPLNALLMGGGLPLKRALDYAVQIADGLSRAHESGIVHRDLKPPNIVVTRDGHLKILDFGLAKLRPFSAEDKTLEVSSDPTLTSPGTLLGTVGYMAPEQVRSETATPASDQFGFGCILFEMLTGQRPFQRASPAETLSAILRDEAPAIQDLNPNVPAPLRWIVERCLSKSARDRYASTRDMARDLQKLRESASESSLRSLAVSLKAPRRRRAMRRAGLVILLFAVAAGGSFLLWEKLRTNPPPTFERLTYRHGVVWRALFAPRAGSILFTASWEGQPTRMYMTLQETAGLDRLLEAEPLVPMAFSPDGSEVLVLLEAFRVPHLLMSGTLARMPALGGKPRRILEQASWADWSRSGKLLAAVRHTGGERILELRDADGNGPHELFRTRGAISFVRFSPDDQWIAFTHHPDVSESAGEVRIVRPDGTSARALTPVLEKCWGLDWNPRTGEIWFTGSQGSQNLLWAITTGGRRREVYAFTDQLVLQSIQPESNRCLLTSQKLRGVLLVRSEAIPARDMSWMRYTRITDLSPDRKRLLFYEDGTTARSGGAYIRPIDGGDAVKLSDWEPGRFSPDGKWIVGLTKDSPSRLTLFPVEAGASRVLETPGMQAADPSFLDADTMLFVGAANGVRRVWRIRTDGSGLSLVGAQDCDLPQPNPARNAFVCEGGTGNRAIFVYPMDGGPGRKLHELSGGRRFWYARFNGRGDRIYAVASDREFFTLDAQTGRVLAQETLPPPLEEGYSELIDATLDSEASIQAYSLNLYASHLYLASGLR